MKTIIASCAALILAVLIWGNSSSQSLANNVTATLVVVEKQKHVMTLYAHDNILRTYHVSLGRGDDSAKQREGDNRTPEGQYIIDAKNDHSQFYKALHISYPSKGDIGRAKTGGYSPGGAVMIHGLRHDLAWLGSLHRLRDWTRGCIAVTNAEMDEIWNVVPVGTPIEIKP